MGTVFLQSTITGYSYSAISKLVSIIYIWYNDETAHKNNPQKQPKRLSISCYGSKTAGVTSSARGHL